MKIGIFGGTYDPVHLGHIWTARSVKDELELNKLFMVVAADPPHKPNNDRTPGAIRYRMLDQALKNEERIFPSDVELKREGKSYTVDTVAHYKSQYRGAELFLVVGGDMLENFPQWREPARILSMAKLVAVSRPDEARDMRALADSIEAQFGGRVIISEFTGPDISSTEVRRRMRDAEPVDLLVTREIEHYMYRNALYMPERISAIKSRLAAVLNKKRLNHTMLTVLEAVKLAYCYSVDTEKARLAALLHDCIKLPNKELIRYCDEHCYDITEEERRNPYLIHARLGAVLAMEEYGVTDAEVLQAIKNHTLGRVGMSTLDKIIYVADKIEPSRDFDGVDEIREVAYRDINEAMLLVMKHSADYTVKNGRAINPSTQAVMDFLEQEMEREKNGVFAAQEDYLSDRL
ncbi:MAG: nicotinate-nucleotide adenylyltransferase [Clostridiales bacterium]|nr:nicotinate-nucleotide adenylyltransferase [Clostridiales bacterium]